MKVCVLLACLFFIAVFMLLLHWTDSFSWDYKSDESTASFDRVMSWWHWIICTLGGSFMVIPTMFLIVFDNIWALLGYLLFPALWVLRDAGQSLIKQWFLKHDTKLLEAACSKLKKPGKHSWHGFGETEVIKALYSLGLGDEIDERRYKAALPFHRFDESAIAKRMKEARAWYC
jgi:hypothetical protein